MPTSRSIVLLPVAAAMLAVAAAGRPVVVGLVALGLEPDAAARLFPVVSAVLAGVGFVGLVVLLVDIVRNQTRAERFAPYRDALRSFAAEFGRGVSETPEGLAIYLQRDGQKVEVNVDPRPDGKVVVTSVPPARQALAWAALSAPLVPPASTGRVVERGLGWFMRAELPAMARPLLADAPLMEVVSRFFGRPGAGSIVHTLGGMRIEGDVPSPSDVDALVRLCVEIAFRLRRVNG
jgi:hypothetical protein